MFYYITYGEFQNYLKNYYLSTNKFSSFVEMAEELRTKSLLSTDYIPNALPLLKHDLSNEEFEKNYSNHALITFPQWTNLANLEKSELDIFPTFRDVFAINHLRYTQDLVHTHNYFEINYVINGHCNFTFENTQQYMSTGDLCIIAPNSKHNIALTDDSTVYTLMIRKSTFERTFLSLLSQKNLLSYFFRTILKDSSRPNYIYFNTSDDYHLRTILRNIIIESNTFDEYSNNCCISLVNLFFSVLLRNYSNAIQFYHCNVDVDFSLILKYIQQNYTSLSLKSLAEYFHYSEAYLSTIIKQNTGHSYSELIRNLRMAEAIEYLKNTNLKVSEISEKIGYNSTDHFSRVFRSIYDISPQNYRKQFNTM